MKYRETGKPRVFSVAIIGGKRSHALGGSFGYGVPLNRCTIRQKYSEAVLELAEVIQVDVMLSPR